MPDLDKALADILAIRSQIAAGTAFQGYGPSAVAATAVVALVTAVLQFLLLDDPAAHPLSFLFGWTAAAAVSAALIFVEMQARSRRHHSGLADAMVQQAVEQFLPAAIAGALLAVMLWKFAPETLWLLPGLWPRNVVLVAAWYFVAGFTVLLIGSLHHTLSPWTMGLPFVIGQLLMAALLYIASEDPDAEH
jgi:hypothetical protein